MIPETALSAYLRTIIENTGRSMDDAKADFFANGWGVRYRNGPTRRHIRISRGRMAWQETVTTEETRASITIMGLAMPDTFFVEGNLHGKSIADVMSLPDDVAPFLSDAVIRGSKATSTGYIPIPLIVLEYEKG